MGLVEDARAAKELHMTYGQYMSTKSFVPYHKPERKTCKNCGAPLIGRRMTFCSKECRDQMKLKNARGDLFV